MTAPFDHDSTTASELRRLWEKYRPVNETRLAVVEAALPRLRTGSTGDPAIAEAARAAHKLAGSLGMFGYEGSSSLAREAEEILESDAPAAERIAAIVDAIRQEISADQSKVPQEPLAAVVSTDAKTNVDVVIVDDDEVIAGLLVYALEKQGYTTGWISDGKQALDRLCGPSADVVAKIIVLDVNLPSVDGMTLLRRLSGEGVTERSHVIMLTVRASESEVVKALQLGANDHVAKPFSLRVFVEKIRRTLKR